MKILIIEDIADINFGGAEKSMFDFIEFLNRNNHEIYLVCSENRYPNNQIIRDFLNIKTTALEFKNFRQFIKNVIQITSFIERHNIDILLTHTIHNFPLLRIIKFFKRVKIYSIFKWVYNNQKIGIKANWGIKCIDKSVFLNDFVSNYWQPFLKSSENRIIPDGLKLQISEKQISQQFTNLLFVGRITEGKGILVLLEALKNLPKEYKLTVVGDFNPLLNSFHSKVQKYIISANLTNRVFLSGLVKNSDILAYYDQADIVIVPSIQPEAQPLVIIESIMRQTPVIYSKLGGVEFMVQKSNFWSFTPNSALALSNKLLQINSTEKKTLEVELRNIRDEMLIKYDIRMTHNMLLNFLFLN